jgi:hypothetical protein
LKIKDTYLLEKDSSIDREFLISALTSHLMTNMNTIVIGNSSSLVNKMISTLGCFMSSDKHLFSCYSLAEQDELSPYFILQGLVTVKHIIMKFSFCFSFIIFINLKENPNDLKSILNAEHILHRNTSTTIIDLSTNTVYRTPLMDDFTFIR